MRILEPIPGSGDFTGPREGPEQEKDHDAGNDGPGTGGEVAAVQEASQQLQTFLSEAERLATVLQLAVKQHYGIRAEKLADFGLKPFRGRQRKSTAKPPAEPATPATDRS